MARVKTDAVTKAEVVRRVEQHPRQHQRTTRLTEVVEQIGEQERQPEGDDIAERGPASLDQQPKTEREREQDRRRLSYDESCAEQQARNRVPADVLLVLLALRRD